MNKSKIPCLAFAFALTLGQVCPSTLAADYSWPSASTENAKSEKTAPALKSETPTAAKASPGKLASPERATSRPRRTAKKRKPIVLYGRLDQIAAEADVKMPVLKAQKAQFDTSAPLRGSATRLRAATRQTRLYTGTQTRSFPVDFSGLWGGHLKVWRYNSSSLSDRIDPKESRQMANILRPGKEGNVNFVFRQAGNSIELEPANVRLTIPAKDSYSYKKMLSGNPQLSGLGGMVSNMMANMQIPVVLHFGTVNTRGSAEVGISGNQIDQRVVKNVIRRLASRVIEEQIVTRNHSVIASSGRSKDGYTESVLRFTRQSPNQLYVLAASVDYSADRKFLRKLIMYGTVQKGVRTNTSIMPQGAGQLSGLMGAGGGAGAGGLGALGNMGNLSSIIKSVSGGGGARAYGGGYGRSNYSGSNANLNSIMRNMQRGGGYGSLGAGGLGARGQGFGQVLKSLNMITR